MVQSMWLKFEDGTASAVLEALARLYGIRSAEKNIGGSGEALYLELKDIGFVKDFLSKARVKCKYKKTREIVPSGSVCELGKDLMGEYLNWYVLELIEPKKKGEVLRLGKTICKHCTDENDRLRILGYSLKYIQRNLKNKEGIESTLDISDAQSGIIQSVCNYKI